jgi:hypothetical protein
MKEVVGAAQGRPNVEIGLQTPSRSSSFQHHTARELLYLGAVVARSKRTHFEL